MLEKVIISNFDIVGELEIDFKRGMKVIKGEKGEGK